MLKTILQPRSLALCAALTIFGVLGGCGPDGGGDGHDDHEEGGHEEGGHDEGGEEEGSVHLTAEQIERAGIEVVKAGPGPIEETLRVAAVVSENLDTQSHVNPRASGLVRAIHKHLGETVEKGEVLCEIDSVAMGEAVSAYQTTRSTSEAARGLLAKEKELFRKRLTARTDVLDGAIALAGTIRDREKSLEAKGLSTLRPLLAAEKAFREAELEKEQSLTELKAERDTRLLQLDAASIEADIALRAATDRLRILGIDPESVPGHGERASASLGLYKVMAPRSGVIVARDVTLDEFVGAETTLFEIDDPSVAWIIASVYEHDLRRVKRGQRVHVSVGALPGAVFEGTVGLIEYEISTSTRTARVRIEIPNHPVEQWPEPFPLRPGMFASVSIVTASGDVGIVVPEDAIVHEGPATFVFVQVDTGKFERREVTLGVSGGGDVEIVSGVKVGEGVATGGTFTLKSAARASELGGGHSH